MTKISAFTSAGALTGAETLVGVQSGNTRKFLVSDLKTYIGLSILNNTGGYKVRDGNNNGYLLSYRSDVVGFPAAYIMPTTNNNICAFDIFPKGTASESAGNGFAWIDICSTDLTLNGTDILASRAGISSTSAYVGSFAFGASTLLPFQICMNSSTVPIMSFSATTIGNVNLDGKMFFGHISTAPTAFVTTGSTTATPGVIVNQGLTTVPVNGALEVDGSGDLYFTKSGSRIKLN